MYRRVVSLFLLPCLLLSQSAAFGHSHGNGDPAGHGLRVHFHTKSASTSVSHHHGHHDHDVCHHHHHADRDTAPKPENQPSTLPESLPDHDSDAVFITSVDVVISERSSIDDELTASAFWAYLWLNPSTAILANPPDQPAIWTHGPSPCSCVCPLYIRHLALLI